MAEFKIGLVTEVKPGFARVKFEDDEIVSDWLHVVVRKTKSDKDSWPLEVNEHVACLMDDNCENGVIVGAIYNEEDTSNEENKVFRKYFKDGTVIEYDANSKKLKADVKGSADVKTQMGVKVDAGTTVDVMAALQVNVNAINVALTGTATVSVTAPTISLAGTAALNIAAPTNITGKLSVTGELSATGEVSSAADVVTGTISLKGHQHQHSGMSGTTTPPIG